MRELRVSVTGKRKTGRSVRNLEGSALAKHADPAVFALGGDARTDSTSLLPRRWRIGTANPQNRVAKHRSSSCRGAFRLDSAYAIAEHLGVLAARQVFKPWQPVESATDTQRQRAVRLVEPLHRLVLSSNDGC